MINRKNVPLGEASPEILQIFPVSKIMHRGVQKA
jgi:hypothetical protein